MMRVLVFCACLGGWSLLFMLAPVVSAHSGNGVQTVIGIGAIGAAGGSCTSDEECLVIGCNYFCEESLGTCQHWDPFCFDVVCCVMFDAQVCNCETYGGCYQCMSTPVEYGNVDCAGPPVPNLDDILCTLGGFGDFLSCPNADLAPVCTGDGIINLDDILAVLAAFGGADPCGCNP